MTLDEKVSFVHGGVDPNSLGQAGYIPGVPRLGIPPLRLTDGPAGVRVTQRSTAMPAPVVLASTFDPSLARKYGEVIGRDGRALGQDVLLSPMVNIIRVPYAGRNFETFSEDPLVSANTVAQEVAGIQSQGLIATTKHFAENNQENNRNNVNVNVDEQTLHEIELAGFEAAVKIGSGSIMCSYNKVNGDPGCGNNELLNTILKNQWGFEGWVMSDWFATHSTDAIVKGLDQEMPGGTFLGDPLKAAIANGGIPEAALNESVRRILGQMQRFDLLRCASPTGARSGCQLPARPSFDAAADNEVALQVAEDGAVLLHNTNNALPLTGQAATSIAVIGTPAKTPVFGGGGSSEVAPTSLTVPLTEIQKRAGSNASVSYAAGIDINGVLIPDANLSGGSINYTGANALPRDTPFSTTRTLTVEETGDYVLNLGLGAAIGSLSIDGTVVAAGFGLTSDIRFQRANIHLTTGAHTLVATVSDLPIPGFLTGPMGLQVNWVTPQAARDNLQAAVTSAQQAKTAILFAYDEGTEGVDRTSLALPYGQDALISAVAAVNPNTIVVLNTGSAITMPWLDSVRSVLDMYYPGQMGGLATARLLFGDATPSGKLTQTFPLDDEQTMVSGNPSQYPGVNDQEFYSEGIDVGYRWYDKNGQATMFPFGFGLSYTTFDYSKLHVSGGRNGLKAEVTVKNTGQRAGSEVVQVYLGPSPDVTDAQQAVRSLTGYQKVSLRPGQSKRVVVKVDERQLSYWNSSIDDWTIGTGTRTVWVGPSSQSLPLSGQVTI